MKSVSAQAEKINQKIKAIVRDQSTVVAFYTLTDDSVQAELRLRAAWSIHFPVDSITWPRNLANDINPLWLEMANLHRQITQVAELKVEHEKGVFPINDRTKIGPEMRSEAKAKFQISCGNAFLSDYKKATGKKNMIRVRSKIESLQNLQKELIPQLRKANSEHLAKRKSAKAERAQQNAEALAAGRFWECDEETLKGYFHPPFSRNYLADVSEKWRAALYTAMDSTAWKAGKGDWRHKNIGTGWAYLCGIDDNGDEWGHRVNLREYMDTDQHGDLGYMATVEDAMSELFDISKSKLESCERQGDLLFCPEEIPVHVTVHPQDGPWEVRESHRIESSTLQRNESWFWSSDPITVTHTSHPAITLNPGEYQLYTLHIADAD